MQRVLGLQEQRSSVELPLNYAHLYRPYLDYLTTKTWRFDDYAREGFAGNAVVYACFTKLLPACSSLELALFKDGDELEAEDMNPGQVALRKLLERPNPYQAYTDWSQTYVLHYLLGGIAYARVIGGQRQQLADLERVTGAELWWMKPDRTKIKHDGMVLTGYSYKKDGGSETTFKPDEIIHVRRPHPGSIFEGMPVLAALERQIDSHTEAVDWNLHLLQNAASSTGIVAIKGIMSLPPAEQLAFLENFGKLYAGARNAGRPVAVASEGNSYTPTTFPPKDMEWDQGRLTTLRDICAALGVPSKLVGDPEAGTFANYEEARKSLYTETAIPIMQALVDELNWWLVPRYDKDTEIVIRYDHIDALTENENDKYERASIADWLTVDEQRRMTGHDETGLPEADIPRTLRSKPEQKDLASGEQLPNLGDSGRSKPAIETRELAFPDSPYPTLEARAAAVDAAEAARLPHERRMEARLRGFFNLQQQRVLSTLEPDDFRSEQRDAAIPPDFWELESKLLAEMLEGMAVGMVIDFGEDALREALAEGLIFEVERPAITEYLTETLAERSKLINQTTADQIRDVLASEPGMSYTRARDAITELYEGQISKGRATAIARTEVGLAQSTATLEGWQQSGAVERKEWVSARDGKVRRPPDSEFDHVSADGEIVELDKPFTRTGEELMMPLIGGSPGNVINCRCRAVPITKGRGPI